MGEVVHLPKRPKGVTIRGAARRALSEALGAAVKPVAVVMVVLGADGKYSLRTASYTSAISDFDMYSRAAAVMDKRRMTLID